jgi:Flp pilus assembly protein TadG
MLCACGEKVRVFNMGMNFKMSMTRKFLSNTEGNYAVIFALSALPVFGAVGLSVDYSNLSRLNYNLSDAVDSMCSVAAKEFLSGKISADVRTAGQNFFKTNIDSQFTNTATATFVLPDDAGNTSKELRCVGQLQYKPIFGPAIAYLAGGDENDYVVVLKEARMKMKNVAEVALVLDNSGSMDFDQLGNGGGPVANKRITLLKKAAKDLVTNMIDVGAKIHAVSEPVKFSIVPFAASVNVGASNATASWMDIRGISSIHHEYLDWGMPSSTNPTGYATLAPDGARLDSLGQPLTRFSILNALSFDGHKGNEDTASCKVWEYNSISKGTPECKIFNRTATGTAPTVSTPVQVTSNAASAATGLSVSNLTSKYSWSGCVEARPNGLDITDLSPLGTNGDAYFVPMFAPDSFNLSKFSYSTKNSGFINGGYNNWWPDLEASSNFTNTQEGQYYQTGNAANDPVSVTTATGTGSEPHTSLTWRTNIGRPRETNVAKYFVNKPLLYGVSNSSATSSNGNRSEWQYYKFAEGPNEGCTTNAITTLTGTKTTLHNAIDAMSPGGYTNIPEGLAWGWRTISSSAPFTQGVSETRKDIDKVVILLTDGANTYESVDGVDYLGNNSNYAAYGYSGYAGKTGTNGIATVTTPSNVQRIAQGTTASATSYTAGNFNNSMNQRMVGNISYSASSASRDAAGGVCKNIKTESIILMTVSLDLNPDLTGLSAGTKEEMRKAIIAMKACAGESRTRKGTDGKPAKLYWNACTGTPYPGCTPLEDAFKEITDELSNLRFAS